MSRPVNSPIEVTELELLPRDGRLLGWHLRPLTPEEHPHPDLALAGWVLAEEKPVLAVEVTHRGHVVSRAPVDLPRADIPQIHPLPHAGSCGYKLSLDLLAGGEGFALEARAVLDPLERVPIARLTARRPPAADAGLVTVVIPCFQQAHFLPDAIESVLAQGPGTVEIVVVDDGSPDNVGAVASRYPGVRYVRQSNGGLAAARNAGLERAAGEFLLFLDADDRLLPGAIDRGLEELGADPQAMMAAGTWTLIGEEGEPLPADPPRQPPAAFPALLESCFISTPAAVLYRRRLFSEIGGFDPEVSASADYDLYLRAAARFPVRLHRHPVAEYRRHGANMTRDPKLIMGAELAVLDRQDERIAGDEELREALERGKRRSREYHGARIAAMGGSRR